MSAKTVAEKLLIKPNTALWSSHPARHELIQPLPESVRQVDRPDEAATALFFADDAGSLREPALQLGSCRGGDGDGVDLHDGHDATVCRWPS